jgi:hypothetical protein
MLLSRSQPLPLKLPCGVAHPARSATSTAACSLAARPSRCSQTSLVPIDARRPSTGSCGSDLPPHRVWSIVRGNQPQSCTPMETPAPWTLASHGLNRRRLLIVRSAGSLARAPSHFPAVLNLPAGTFHSCTWYLLCSWKLNRGKVGSLYVIFSHTLIKRHQSYLW